MSTSATSVAEEGRGGGPPDGGSTPTMAHHPSNTTTTPPTLTFTMITTAVPEITNSGTSSSVSLRDRRGLGSGTLRLDQGGSGVGLCSQSATPVRERSAANSFSPGSFEGGGCRGGMMRLTMDISQLESPAMGDSHDDMSVAFDFPQSPSDATNAHAQFYLDSSTPSSSSSTSSGDGKSNHGGWGTHHNHVHNSSSFGRKGSGPQQQPENNNDEEENSFPPPPRHARSMTAPCTSPPCVSVSPPKCTDATATTTSHSYQTKKYKMRRNKKEDDDDDGTSIRSRFRGWVPTGVGKCLEGQLVVQRQRTEEGNESYSNNDDGGACAEKHEDDQKRRGSGFNSHNRQQQQRRVKKEGEEEEGPISSSRLAFWGPPVNGAPGGSSSLETAVPEALRLLTYNVLAMRYVKTDKYPHCPPWSFADDYRAQSVAKEVWGSGAHVIALQELSADMYVKPGLIGELLRSRPKAKEQTSTHQQRRQPRVSTATNVFNLNRDECGSSPGKKIGRRTTRSFPMSLDVGDIHMVESHGNFDDESPGSLPLPDEEEDDEESNNIVESSQEKRREEGEEDSNKMNCCVEETKTTTTAASTWKGHREYRSVFLPVTDREGNTIKHSLDEDFRVASSTSMNQSSESPSSRSEFSGGSGGWGGYRLQVPNSSTSITTSSTLSSSMAAGQHPPLHITPSHHSKAAPTCSDEAVRTCRGDIEGVALFFDQSRFVPVAEAPPIPPSFWEDISNAIESTEGLRTGVTVEYQCTNGGTTTTTTAKKMTPIHFLAIRHNANLIGDTTPTSTSSADHYSSSKLLVKSHNVSLLLPLWCLETKSVMLFMTTHLYWDSHKPEVQVLHLQTMMKAADVVKGVVSGITNMTTNVSSSRNKSTTIGRRGRSPGGGGGSTGSSGFTYHRTASSPQKSNEPFQGSPARAARHQRRLSPTTTSLSPVVTIMTTSPSSSSSCPMLKAGLEEDCGADMGGGPTFSSAHSSFASAAHSPLLLDATRHHNGDYTTTTIHFQPVLLGDLNCTAHETALRFLTHGKVDFGGAQQVSSSTAHWSSAISKAALGVLKLRNSQYQLAEYQQQAMQSSSGAIAIIVDANESATIGETNGTTSSMTAVTATNGPAANLVVRSPFVFQMPMAEYLIDHPKHITAVNPSKGFSGSVIDHILVASSTSNVPPIGSSSCPLPEDEEEDSGALWCALGSTRLKNTGFLPSKRTPSDHLPVGTILVPRISLRDKFQIDAQFTIPVCLPDPTIPTAGGSGNGCGEQGSEEDDIIKKLLSH